MKAIDWFDWFGYSLLVGGLLFGAVTLLLMWRFRRQERKADAERLPPPEERPDYRRLLAEIRVCPECTDTYLAKIGFRAEQSCDKCVAKRFEASVEADKEYWRGQGWRDVGDD